MSFLSRFASLATAAVATAALTGCGLGPNASYQVPTAVKGAAIQGSVHGGQQAVVGATIKLYATGSTGYGSQYAYTTGTGNLLTTTVTSVGGGNFSITGDYTCPSASTPVYLVALGGNSGFTTNNNLALMAALGPCGNLMDSTFVTINEVTTVASVYALAPFMTGATSAYATIGTSASNATGLANAMADVNVLANVATGDPAASLASPYASTVVSGATMPVPAIDTLADIIAACVNSGGGAAGSNTNCGTLFTATTQNGTAPTDTITALLNIAEHPASNVSTLYGLPVAASPFQPTLTSQPNDFLLAANFTAGGISQPTALATDASGNVWTTNGNANTVTELAHTGAPVSGASGYAASFSTPSALALASDGTVWVTNQGNNTVSRISSAGAAVSGSPYSGGGLSQPKSISFDSLGNAWVANAGNASATVINSSGTTLTNYTPAGASSPLAIGVNPH